MSIKDEELTEQKVSRAVRKAFKKLIQDIENEPGLILEGESQPVDGENSLTEIRSWLFKKGEEDGITNN